MGRSVSEHRLKLIGEDGLVHSQVSIRATQMNGECVISVTDGTGVGERFSGQDFFSALAVFSDFLGRAGLKPACLGAVLFVYPSGMCRDMGLGLSAYLLKKGQKQASKDDLVNIFDPLPSDFPLELLVSPEEQERYRMELIKGE